MKVTIIMGKHKGPATTTKKKAKDGFVVVKLPSGVEILIHKQFIK